MTDDEANQIYEKLSDMLTEVGMRWVLADVAQELVVGKLEPKKLSAADIESGDEGFLFPPTSRRGTATFTATTEYAAKERLRILVAAIEQVCIATADMDPHTAKVFLQEVRPNGNHPATQITFQAETGTGQHRSDPSIRARRSDLAGRLKPLIGELREGIDAD